MPFPAALSLIGIGGRRGGQGLEDGLPEGQREAFASLAKGRGGEGSPGAEAEVLQGGVAGEDLVEEPVDEGHGGQESRAPGVAEFSANGMDEVGVEVEVKVLPEGPQGVIKESMHRRSLRGHGRVVTP